MQGVVNEEFKMMGLSMRGDAMAAVVDFLERCDDPHEALSQMLDELDAKALTTSIVDLRCAEEVIHAVDKRNGTGAFAAPDGQGTAALLDDEEKNWAWATQGDSSRQTNSKRRVAKNTSNPC